MDQFQKDLRFQRRTNRVCMFVYFIFSCWLGAKILTHVPFSPNAFVYWAVVNLIAALYFNYQSWMSSGQPQH